MSSVTQTTIQVALALNNVGVSLLERGCHSQGLAVLKDGIDAMKEIIKSSRDELNLITSQLSSRNLQLAIDRTLHLPPKTIPCASIDVQVVSYQASGITGILSTLNASPSFSRYYLIRMDVPLECSSCFDLETPDIESAILLYNYSMAYLLWARVHMRPEPLLENAHRILHLVCNVVARSSAICFDAFEKTALLQVGLLVLHGNIQVFIRTGNDKEAADVYVRYLTVRGAVENLQNVMDWYTSLIVSAPAA